MVSQKKSRSSRYTRFCADKKNLTLILFKQSPKSSRLLPKNFISSSAKTLRDFLHKIEIEAGIDIKIFKRLREKDQVE